MGYGSNAIRHCTSVPNYAAAEVLFLRPKPKGSKWSENERPLEGNDKWHYRVQKDTTYGVATYGLYLYHTCMIRYHKPEHDGSYVVDYTSDDRSASSEFMWRMGSGARMGRNLDFDSNRQQVLWPLGGQKRNAGYSASIAYNSAKRIIRERSDIGTFYTTSMSDETLALRKKVKDVFANLIDLACMMTYEPVFGLGGFDYRDRDRMQWYVQNGAELPEGMDMHIIKRLCRKVHESDAETPAEKVKVCRKELLSTLFTGKSKITDYPKWETDVPESASIRPIQ